MDQLLKDIQDTHTLPAFCSHMLLNMLPSFHLVCELRQSENAISEMISWFG